MKKNNQKGTSLLLTILIMAALLAIAVGISRLGLGEIKLTRDVSKALISYYAADAGIEAAIYADRTNTDAPPLGPGESTFQLSACLDSPANEICYNVDVTGSVSNPPPIRLIKSKGSYKDVERAIELTF